MKFYGVKALKTLEDWKGLANSWKPGRSAYELARSWQEAQELPLRVKEVFERSNDPELAGFVPSEVFVEFPVVLDTEKAPSMNDLMVHGTSSTGEAVVVAVEGKVHEPFDRPVCTWIRDSKADPKPTRLRRLAFLNSVLGTSIGPDDAVPYQLVHRTASGVMVAQMRGARRAVMLVHAFGPLCSENIEAFAMFSRHLGVASAVGELSQPVSTGIEQAIQLSIGWVQDELSPERTSG